MSSVPSPGPDSTAGLGDEPRSNRPPFALIAAITITGILANTLVSAPLPDILEDFGRPDSAAGFIIAASSVPGIVVAPLIGLMADRYGRRTVLVPCLVVFGIGGTLGGLAPTFWILILARFVQGIGSAGLINLTNILIGDHWDGIERSRMYGYNSAVLTVSLAVLPGVGGLLADLGTWRWAFIPFPLAFITAVVVRRRLEPGVVDRSRTVRDQLHEAVEVVRSPTVIAPVLLSLLTFVFVFGLMLTVLPVHLEEEFGLGAGARGLVIAAPALGATAGALLLGRLRRVMSARSVAALSFGLFAVGYPIVGLAPTILLVLVAAVLLGLGEGLVLPTLTDLVAGSAPERNRGAVLSVQVSAIRAGQSTGPLLGSVGMGVATTGAVFVAGGAVAAVIATVTGLAPRPSRAPEPAGPSR